MADKSPADELVDYIATKAMAENTPFAEAVDALKAITAWKTMLLKKKEPESDPEDNEPSFDTFREGLQEVNKDPAHGGVTPLPRRRAQRL